MTGQLIDCVCGGKLKCPTDPTVTAVRCPACKRVYRRTPGGGFVLQTVPAPSAQPQPATGPTQPPFTQPMPAASPPVAGYPASKPRSLQPQWGSNPVAPTTQPSPTGVAPETTRLFTYSPRPDEPGYAVPGVGDTVASNPAAVRVSLLRYWYCYPLWLTVCLAGAIVSSLVGYFLHYSFFVTAAVFAITLVLIMTSAVSAGRNGNLGSAVVISTNPYLIATYLEMSKTRGEQWPAIVITRAPLARAIDGPYEVGRKLPVICTYLDMGGLRHWDNVSVWSVATVVNRVEIVRAREQRMETPEEGTHKLNEHWGRIPQPYRPGIYFLRPGAPFGLTIEGWRSLYLLEGCMIRLVAVVSVVFMVLTAWTGWIWLLQGAILPLFGLGVALARKMGIAAEGDVAPGVVIKNNPYTVAFYADFSRTPELWLPAICVQEMALQKLPNPPDVGAQLPVIIYFSPSDEAAPPPEPGGSWPPPHPSLMAFQVGAMPAAYFTDNQEIIRWQFQQIDPNAWQILNHGLATLGTELKDGVYPLRYPNTHWTDEIVQKVQTENA